MDGSIEHQEQVFQKVGQAHQPYAIHTNLKTEVTTESIERLISEVSYAATLALAAKTDIDSSRARDRQPLKAPFLPIAFQILTTLGQRNVRLEEESLLPSAE